MKAQEFFDTSAEKANEVGRNTMHPIGYSFVIPENITEEEIRRSHTHCWEYSIATTSDEYRYLIFFPLGRPSKHML